MPITITTEKRFEDDITASLWSEGGYTRNGDVYDAKLGLFPDTLVGFVRRTQPKAWARFENANKLTPFGSSARRSATPARWTASSRCCGMGSSTGAFPSACVISGRSPR